MIKVVTSRTTPLLSHLGLAPVMLNGTAAIELRKKNSKKSGGAYNCRTGWTSETIGVGRAD